MRILLPRAVHTRRKRRVLVLKVPSAEGVLPLPLRLQAPCHVRAAAAPVRFGDNVPAQVDQVRDKVKLIEAEHVGKLRLEFVFWAAFSTGRVFTY